MTIYVDALFKYPQGEYCHMWSDVSDEECLRFATQVLWLQASYAQMSHGAILKDFYHFDLTPSKRLLALAKGAIHLSLKDYLKRVQSEGNKPDG